MTSIWKWKSVSYPNKQGLKLAGLLYSGPTGGTLVVVCHGFTGSKEGGGRAVVLAEEMGKRGYATLLFDFSGCGESEGAFADITLTGHIECLASSVDYGLACGFQRVITLGRSFGGTTVLCHAALDKRIAGVCTWAAPAELSKLFNAFREKENAKLIPLTDLSGTVMVSERFFTDLEQHDPAHSAAMIAPRPLLVMHGQSDAVVPVANALLISSSAGTPKELRIIPQADHQFTRHYREAWQITLAWLAEHFPL
ncbi:MAG: alpha/beta hydrolase [Desulfotomaculaceae bacterium]|nr:alpha/beta hydrolase [Desulfotomaculaceae bacterium]